MGLFLHDTPGLVDSSQMMAPEGDLWKNKIAVGCIDHCWCHVLWVVVDNVGQCLEEDHDPLIVSLVEPHVHFGVSG